MLKKATKVIGKILRGILIALVTIIIILFVVRLIGRAVNGRTPDGGINESMLVDINGTKQWINIYGHDKDNPVLLYLHGGPGSATSHLDYAFTRKWSDVYTVVTWDQRGCGKSYKTSKTDTITADIMMQDGKEMTEYLLEYMGKDKITLLGHSWGSMYGANLALEYPDYYGAFIGTGQFIDDQENEQRLYEAAQEWCEGDEEGKAMENYPSSFEAPVELTETATEEQFLDHEWSSVYQIQNLELADAVGTNIFTFPFSYSGGTTLQDGFLMNCPAGLFLFAGMAVEFAPVSLAEEAVIDECEEEAVEDIDELDFSMI